MLFDLDGTLLDVDLDAFLRRYFLALGSVAAPHFPGVAFQTALLASTSAMQRPHPGRTNKEVFDADFLARTGFDVAEKHEIFDDFYRDVFPTLADDYGPAPGSRAAVETAKALGLKTAIATQPIFPAAAIAHRLAWAGLDDVAFDAITTYEIMLACKPQAAYFEQAAAMIGCTPKQCLMVGDDRGIDMPASEVGMRTFYVGSDPETPADHRGTLTDLADLLQRSV